MNKRLKHIGYIVVMVAILMTTGCNNKNNNNDQIDNPITNNGNENEVTNTPEGDVTGKEDVTDDKSGEEEKNETNNKDVEPVVTKEVNIYTMNETTLTVESAVALVPFDTELTPEIIVDMVVDSFADRLVTIGIDSVTTKEDTVIVSFLKDAAPLFNAGGGLESTILDAIAQSLVDNLPNYPKVIFRAEGEAYASGHYEFDIDEVYLDNNRTN
jgi:hypothetical protein